MLRQAEFAGSARALPVLVLGYSVLMMHLVFCRAFRDSLLGSHLAVKSLPELTVLGTLLAITLSLVISFFERTRERIVVVRCVYAVNGSVEILMALAYRTHQWLYSAYYIEVSASTALGLSLIWVLIGDWTSRCNEKSGDKIPLILICGTSAGMFAGLSFVHIPGALHFGTANLMLAGMHAVVVLALLFYRDDLCTRNTERLRDWIARGKRQLTRGLVRTLALVAVFSAMTSTLLDLVFRVAIAQRYTQQIDRLQFVGGLQSALSLGALLSQLLMTRLHSQRAGMGLTLLHPAVVTLMGCAAAFLPSFWVLGAYRTMEYSLRNSTLRFGAERALTALPDDVRGEARPLIDVVSERLGDLAAAGFLQLLFLDNPGLAMRPALITVAGCSLVLLLAVKSLIGRAEVLEHFRAPRQPGGTAVSLHGMAKQSSAQV